MCIFLNLVLYNQLIEGTKNAMWRAPKASSVKDKKCK